MTSIQRIMGGANCPAKCDHRLSRVNPAFDQSVLLQMNSTAFDSIHTCGAICIRCCDGQASSNQTARAEPWCRQCCAGQLLAEGTCSWELQEEAFDGLGVQQQLLATCLPYLATPAYHACQPTMIMMISNMTTITTTKTSIRTKTTTKIAMVFLLCGVSVRCQLMRQNICRCCVL